jgi:hypothetical protein
MFLGIFFVVAMVSLSHFAYVRLSVFVAVILAVCALLETLFDFCIGCRIYYLIQLVKVMHNDRNFD